jgi:hypothetical protein
MPDDLEFKPIGTLKDHYMRDVTVIRIKGPYGTPVLFYQSTLNVDWDGAPTAYGVDKPGSDIQKGLKAHEYGVHGLLKSGLGSDGTWAGVFSATEKEARDYLASDSKFGGSPKDRIALLPQFLDTRYKDIHQRSPVVQFTDYNSRSKGYYVSQCKAIADPTAMDWDQHKYHDAASVPYGALSDGLRRLGPGDNDFGLVIRNNNGASTGFFFGDRAGRGSQKVGECSGYVKTTIAPERNQEDNTFSFFVFPGSGNGMPSKQAPDLIDSVVQFRMQALFLAKNARKLAILTALGPKILNSPQAEMTDRQNTAYQAVKPAFSRLGWNPDGTAFSLD